MSSTSSSSGHQYTILIGAYSRSQSISPIGSASTSWLQIAPATPTDPRKRRTEPRFCVRRLAADAYDFAVAGAKITAQAWRDMAKPKPSNASCIPDLERSKI